MMHQQFPIWWPILWFPLILTQFQQDKMCFKNVDFYECVNLNISEVGLHFKWFNENDGLSTSTDIHLKLTGVIFDQNALTFQNLRMENPIQEFMLYGGMFNGHFVDRPFRNRVFDYLEVLCFVDIPIEYIFVDTFVGLRLLEKLHLHGVKLKELDGSAFESTPRLDLLSIDNGFEYTYPNKFRITFPSIVQLYSLTRISIINTNKYINLGGRLDISTFVGSTNLRRLILRNNSIETVPLKLFQNILLRLEFLDLSLNRLKSLPMHIFEPLIFAAKQQTLFLNLAKNKWNYRCNIQSLAFYLIDGETNVDIQCLYSRNQIYLLDTFLDNPNIFNDNLQLVNGIEVDSTVGIGYGNASALRNGRRRAHYEMGYTLKPALETIEENVIEDDESDDIDNKKDDLGKIDGSRSTSASQRLRANSLKHQSSRSELRPKQKRRSSSFNDRFIAQLSIQNPINVSRFTSLNKTNIETPNEMPTKLEFSVQMPSPFGVDKENKPPVDTAKFGAQTKPESITSTENLCKLRSCIICTLSNERKTPLVITNQSQIFQIEQITFRDWLLSVNNFPTKSALIEIERSDDIKAMTCVTNIGNIKKTAFKQRLASNRAYRYCWMQTNMTTVNPLNCISLIPFGKAKVNEIDVWILTKYMTWVLAGCGTTAFIAFILGCLIAIALAKLFPKKIRGKLPTQLNGKQEIETMPEAGFNANRRYSYATVQPRSQRMNNAMCENFSPGIEDDIYAYPKLYLHNDAVPPPLPAKRIAPAKLATYDCCNAEICECYCEL